MAATHTVTSRYGVGPLTGWPTMRVSSGGKGRKEEPPTIWYVHDRCDSCHPVAVFKTEVEARRHAFLLNAEERRWEKNE
jgi:hypothetical protein